MRWMPKGRLARVVALAAWGGWAIGGALHAQTATPVTPEEEYKKNIRVSEEIQPLGENPFGESIGLSSGGLSFEQTDVSAAGIGPVLSLSRTFSLPSQQDRTGLKDNAFGNWDLDLPRITTITANQQNVTGWQVASAHPRAICSQFNPPPSVNPPAGNTTVTLWAPSQWWHGYQLVMPGQGSQDLLKRGSANTLAPTMGGMSFPIVTRQQWQISCLAQAENDSTIEAFLAVAPDGTKYWFNHLAYRYAPNMERGKGAVPLGAMRATASVSPNGGVQPMVSATDYLVRREAAMLVTRIEDRFGNTLTYSYDGSNRLTGITASDGRALSVQYGDGTPLIRSVTLQPAGSAPRTWTYGYGAGTGDIAGTTELQSVTLPDGSAWHFDLAALTNGAWVDTSEAASVCNAPAVPNNLGTSYSGSITHPSGLTGTFTVTPVKRGRSYVARDCWTAQVGGGTGPTDPNTFATTPNAWYAMAITQRVYSGAGLPTRTWTYAYSPSNESWTADACAGAGSCPTTVWTDETDPSGNGTRYTFSNRFDASESLLLRTDTYRGAVGGTRVRSEVNGYADPTGGPWPAALGDNLQTYVNPAQTETLSPLSQRQIVQDGDTYTWQAEAFNAYAQVTQARRFSAIAGQGVLEEQTGYLNDPALWVLGLPTTVTNVATGEVESQNVYDSAKDTLKERWRFGQKLMSYSFDAQGNLASFTDGNNHTTTLGSYQRGIPQAIGYPDGTSQHLVVDDFGQIRSITDPAGSTTSYDYDAMGRLTTITYPTGDEQAWYPRTFAYAYVPSAERGIAANHWRRTVSQGDYRQVTWFDATLRPVLTDTYSAADGSSHTSTRTDYDWRGQTTFASYPVAGSPDLGGITAGARRTYDALGRLTAIQQDSELGTLTTTTAYLSGARQQVTDPKGNVTTTSYQVFDAPAYDRVIQVQAPEGITQAITRDLYGHPTAIRQYGSNNGYSGDVTKTLVYDSYHRLCRTTEPESGSTVTAYDGANNVAWTAEGLSLTGTGCGQEQVAAGAKTTRTYDAMNRVLTLLPPSGTQSTTYTYDALGHLKSAVSGVTTWTGTYNKLGQLTGEALQLAGQNAWGIGYAHDAYGHLSQVHYPDQYVDYAPDALGRATRIGNYATNISYFPDGAVQGYTLG
ncbi:YD repeat-containing protein, partial [Fulvimonas soli]